MRQIRRFRIEQNDPELMRENKKMAATYRKEAKKVVLVKFRKPEPVAPELELMKNSLE